MNNNPRPTFEVFADASRFFIDAKDANGDDKKLMVNLRKSCVVLTLPLKNGGTEKVAFYKTNRGKNYRDSRGKKVTKKDASGETVTIMRPLMIDESEVKSELLRLLQDSWEAEQAFRALQV